MTGYLKDFKVEILNDGKTSILFECGHSLMGKNIEAKDLSHCCNFAKRDLD